MDIRKLKEILSIPTYYSHEGLIKEYLINFAECNNILSREDSYGNVYLFKGELSDGEYYPCVVSHIDTVYKNQIPLISENKLLELTEVVLDGDIYLSSFNGIGGDDKCGVFICLELLLKSDKLMAGFFVEEEYGCNGSKNADRSMFDKVGYVIQFDAPGNNWCSEYCAGIKLYDDHMLPEIQPILDKYSITNISNDPYTDVVMLRLLFNLNCFNFFAGYYNQHCGKIEYVSVNDIEKSINFGYDLINLLGYIKK